MPIIEKPGKILTTNTDGSCSYTSICPIDLDCGQNAERNENVEGCCSCKACSLGDTSTPWLADLSGCKCCSTCGKRMSLVANPSYPNCCECSNNCLLGDTPNVESKCKCCGEKDNDHHHDNDHYDNDHHGRDRHHDRDGTMIK